MTNLENFLSEPLVKDLFNLYEFKLISVKDDKFLLEDLQEEDVKTFSIERFIDYVASDLIHHLKDMDTTHKIKQMNTIKKLYSIGDIKIC